MNKKQREAIAAYVREIADLVELRDWTFDLNWEPLPNDVQGAMFPTFGQKRPTIRFGTDFLEVGPERQRHIIVHELVHCHLEPSTNLIDNTLPDLLGSTAYRIFDDAFVQDLEFATDALATALAKHLPLPPEL